MPFARIAFWISVFLLSSQAVAQPLRVAVSNTVLSLPLYVAESEGFFKKHGVDVRLQNCVGGVRCMKQMLGGEAELATATELPVVFNSFARNDFAILTSFVTTSTDIKILVRSDAKVRDTSDLTGKRIAYVKGAASQYFLNLVLLYHAIDPANVELKQTFPESARSDIQSGLVDAISIWEPFAQQILSENPGKVIQLKVPKLYTETFNLVSMRSVIEIQPQQIERILLALKDACDFIQKNPEASKKLLSVRLNTPFQLIDRNFFEYRYRLSLTQSLVRTMDGQASWAIREQHVDKASKVPNYLDFIEPGPLKTVDPSAVTVR